MKKIFLGLGLIFLCLPLPPLQAKMELKLDTETGIEKSGAALDIFISRIKKHNDSIETYYGGIYATGMLKRKKFKAEGQIWSEINKDLIKLRFVDLIFKSPISIFLMKGENIILVYPAQNKKIFTTRKDFEPAYDAGLPLPSELLLPMLKGHFYIPENLEHKSLEKKANGEKIILVNEKYIINYLLGKNGFPYLALYQSRKDKKNVVFKYKNFKKVNGILIPHSISIELSGTRSYLNLSLTWLRINQKIGNVWSLN